MTNLIDRTIEVAALRALAKRGKPALALLYGRRRGSNSSSERARRAWLIHPPLHHWNPNDSLADSISR
jgi:hypothetical protein